MGTRGAWGFLVDGDDSRITYNHFDSYPSGLGANLVKAIGKLLASPEKSVARDKWEAGGKKGRAPTSARVAVQVDPLGVLREDARKIRVIDGETTPTKTGDRGSAFRVTHHLREARGARGCWRG